MTAEALVEPISDDEPCGQDLDLEEDGAYLQFTSLTEALLPDSYMVEDEEGKRVPFYAAQRFQGLDLNARVAAGQKLLERTHDLRLLATLAKLHLLNRSLPRFESTVGTMALLLDSYWVDVHPQGAAERSGALERLTEPLLLAALNHATLFKSRRFGMVTWLSYLAATRTAEDGSGGLEGVDRILMEEIKADPTPVAEAQALVGKLHASLLSIMAICADKLETGAPKLGKILDPVAAMVAMFERLHPIAAGEVSDGASEGGDGVDPSEGVGGVFAAPLRPSSLPLLPSAEAAQAALAEAVRFFAAVEPSSPCLLLLRQAQALVGKSFFEAMQALVPDSVSKAVFPFSATPPLNLPLRQVADSVAAAWEGASGEPDPAAVERLFNTVTSRGEALGLLDQVSAFYRFVEPSSPIPLLVDRARALAGKDFTALLKALLPEKSSSDY